MTFHKRNPVTLVGVHGADIEALGGAIDRGNDNAPAPSRQAKWQAKNPLARWCHVATASAIRRGILVRPDRCDCCGKVGPVDAHHPDHRDPLRVQWLQRACHVRLHAAERAEGGGDE